MNVCQRSDYIYVRYYDKAGKRVAHLDNIFYAYKYHKASMRAPEAKYKLQTHSLKLLVLLFIAWLLDRNL